MKYLYYLNESGQPMLVNNLRGQPASVFESQESVELVLNFDELENGRTLNILKEISTRANLQKVLIDPCSFVLTNKNVTSLLNLRRQMRESLGCDVEFSTNEDIDYWSVEKTLVANQKLEAWAKTILNAKVDGRGLSPAERFMYAYILVTQFVYNEVSADESKLLSREVVGVLNSNKIVCAGYSALLSELCSRIGVACFEQFLQVYQKTGNDSQGHANCRIFLNDKIYGIKGVYYCDPCWDSKKDKSSWQTIANAFVNIDKVLDAYAKQNIVIDQAQQDRNLLKWFCDSFEGGMTNACYGDGNRDLQQFFSARSQFVLKQVIDFFKAKRKELKVEFQGNGENSYYGEVVQRKIEEQAFVWLGLSQGEDYRDYAQQMFKIANADLVQLLAKYSDEQLERKVANCLDYAYGMPIKISQIEKFNTLLQSRYSPSQIDLNALTYLMANVYKAMGFEKEDAELKAMEMILQSARETIDMFDLSLESTPLIGFSRTLHGKNEIENG